MALDHASLPTCIAKHITEEGLSCVVLPVDIGSAFIEWVTAIGRHLRLRTDVAETELRLPHRALLAFSPTTGECFSDRLAIHGPEQQCSEGLTAPTRDFYLFI